MSDSEALMNDYELLTSGCGFVELADWTTIAITGEDRVTFLHNMCTNDIKRLSVGESCEAFCTDVKGKIVAHVLVTVHEDRLLLLTVPGQAEKLISQLDRYVIREDVQLLDATADHAWFATGATELRTKWPVGKSRPHDSTINPYTWAGSLFQFASDELLRAKQLFTTCGLEKCIDNAWEILRIESGLPLFGIDFDSSNLPQEINRDDLAINFNKGCYLGQETIARIDALGHVNQKIVSVQFTGETLPPVGAELSKDGKTVGHVTSRCCSPKRNAPLALAMVRRGANEAGSQLESDLGTATVLQSS